MNFWTPASIRTAAGGNWLSRPDDLDAPTRPMQGVSTDTRAIKQGQVFIALRGDNFDAHDFLEDALEHGASMLIVDDPRKADAELVRHARGIGILRVPDTGKALVKLATAYRQTLEGTRVIAVTGSNGKTTTTRLIDSVLSTRLRGTCSAKSHNNIIGVPLTVLAAHPGDQYLVCEVGMNAPGEIAPLARICEPDVAVITSIGRAHFDAFGSIEGIAKEKASLLSYLRPGGVAVVTADTPYLSEYLRPIPNVVTFGQDPKADLRVSHIEHTHNSTLKFTVNDRFEYTLPLLGEHNAMNAAAAIAVARRLGLDHPEIQAGLAGARPAEMRLTRLNVGGIDVFNDAYNASPESMIAGIRTFASLTKNAKRRVLILGDMLELGSHAAAAHAEVGDFVREHCPVDLLVTVGPSALLIAERFSADARSRGKLMIHSSLDDEQAARIVERLSPGDSVLVKASRRVGLERIIKALEKRSRRAEAVASAAR